MVKVSRERKAVQHTLISYRSALPVHFIEKIKCTLQVQAAMEQQRKMLGTTAAFASSGAIASQPTRMYSTTTLPNPASTERFTGPIDVIKQTVKVQGITGMWKGFGVSLVYRTSFAVSRNRLVWQKWTDRSHFLGHVWRQVTASHIISLQPLTNRHRLRAIQQDVPKTERHTLRAVPECVQLSGRRSREQPVLAKCPA